MLEAYIPILLFVLVAIGFAISALVFAWLWRRSGSLWAPALFHMAANLLMELLLASTFRP